MAAEPAAGIYDDRPVEVDIEDNGTQSLVAIETDHGQVVATVDETDLDLSEIIQLARDVRGAIERARGGEGQ